MNSLRILSAVILFGVFVSPAMAEDTKVETKAEVKAKAPATPLDVLQTATTDMMKGLDENQIKQFSAISNSFTIIRTVEDVQQSISTAVDSCVKANPDLKDGMTARFETWKDAVRPVIKKSKSKLDKMILLQGFTQPSVIRAYLKKFDAAYIFRNQKLKPNAIHKAEDCKRLQSNMDKTQHDLVILITDTLGLNDDLKVKEN